MPNPKRKGSTRQWRKLRALVLKRDSGICWYCGQPGADTVDHLLPYEHGGTDDLWNLAAMHGRRSAGCIGNYAKGAKTQRRRKRRSGATPTPGALSLSDDLSPGPQHLVSYHRSTTTSRVRREDVTEGE